MWSHGGNRWLAELYRNTLRAKVRLHSYYIIIVRTHKHACMYAILSGPDDRQLRIVTT